MNKLLTVVAGFITIAALLVASRHQDFRRVNAAGPSVRVLSGGQGSPTVVFEAGAGSPLETWSRIQPAISRMTSAFSYDRAGNGLSGKGPVPRDARQIATELHAALQNATAAPPYVLVGHSLGGPFIRVFAGMYPKEVAGLILVDPTQEELIAWARERKPKGRPKDPLRLQDEVDCAEFTFAQAKESRLPDVPVVLITGMGPKETPGFLPEKLKQEVQKDQEIFYPAKLEFHKSWVESFPQGQLVVTQRSGHGIPWEEPELVIDIIQKVVARVRGSGP